MTKIPLRGMTLLELMISMTIFALVMISVVASVQSMSMARLKSVNRMLLTEQLYFFSEQLFTEIKNGGTIDYEEYWNRKIVGTDISNGYYTIPTGVGNYGYGGNIGTDTYGSGVYYCRSDSGQFMGTDGCIEDRFNSS